jgi:hypothetical protein
MAAVTPAVVTVAVAEAMAEGVAAATERVVK